MCILLIFFVQFSLFLIRILPINVYSLCFRTLLFSALFFCWPIFLYPSYYCPFSTLFANFSLFFQPQSRILWMEVENHSILNLFHKIKSFHEDFFFSFFKVKINFLSFFFDQSFKRLEINAETSSMILYSSLVSDLQ